jgi:flavin reductase (DIM6/NTAB) family NADH-FMN oxidoreductase RutF
MDDQQKNKPISIASNSPINIVAESFIDAMRYAVTPVTIVTTAGSAGEFGLTVSAFSSVSADPPLVLVCIKQSNQIEAAIRANGVFCVNLLSSGQSDLADAFAGRSKTIAPYDFAAAQWKRGITGSRLLIDATASFECEMYNAVEAGTHSLLMGRVIGLATSELSPLAYQDRGYRSLHPLS